MSRTRSTSPQLAAHHGQGTESSTLPYHSLKSILDAWHQASVIRVHDVRKWVEETGVSDPFGLLPQAPGTDGEIVRLSASIRSKPVDNSQHLEGALPVVLFSICPCFSSAYVLDYDPVVPDTVWGGGLKEQADEDSLYFSEWNLALPEPKSLIWGTECEQW